MFCEEGREIAPDDETEVGKLSDDGLLNRALDPKYGGYLPWFRKRVTFSESRKFFRPIMRIGKPEQLGWSWSGGCLFARKWNPFGATFGRE